MPIPALVLFLSAFKMLLRVSEDELVTAYKIVSGRETVAGYDMLTAAVLAVDTDIILVHLNAVFTVVAGTFDCVLRLKLGYHIVDNIADLLVRNKVALLGMRRIERGDTGFVERLSEYRFVFLERGVDLIAIADEADINIGVCAVEKEKLSAVEKRI